MFYVLFYTVSFKNKIVFMLTKETFFFCKLEVKLKTMVSCETIRTNFNPRPEAGMQNFKIKMLCRGFGMRFSSVCITKQLICQLSLARSSLYEKRLISYEALLRSYSCTRCSHLVRKV